MYRVAKMGDINAVYLFIYLFFIFYFLFIYYLLFIYLFIIIFFKFYVLRCKEPKG